MGAVVVIEGPIGAGKTTLAEELAEELGAKLLTEPDEERGNYWLQTYYKDRDRWAFTMQAHLLASRFGIHQLAQWSAKTGQHAVIDRPFYGDTAFARLQVRRGHMNQDELDTYRLLFDMMTTFVALPPIMILLRVEPEVSLARIAHRAEERDGRKCERVIEHEYLSQLNVEIEYMAEVLDEAGVHVIPVDWDEPRNKAERAEVMRAIATEIREVADQPHDLFADLYKRKILLNL